MSMLNAIIQLGLATASAEEVRLQRVKAHDERNSCRCEGEEAGENPCWKGWDYDCDGNAVKCPRPDEFCEPCKKRQAHHDEFIRLGPIYAGRRSKVARLARQVNAMLAQEVTP